MEQLFEKIAQNLILNSYKSIGVIDIQTQTAMMFSLDAGLSKPIFEYDYDAIIAKVCALCPEFKRERLASELSMSSVIAAMDKCQGIHKVDYETAELDGKKTFLTIGFSYFDDSHSTFVISFYDETEHTNARLDLIRKLRRTEDRFNFVLNRVCDGFIEIDPYTGDCIMLRSSNGRLSKGKYADQIEWFASNMIIDSEREAYLADFELGHLMDTLRTCDGIYASTYTVMYEDGKHNMYIINALIRDSANFGSEYIIAFSQDITMLKLHEEQNQKLIDISQYLLQVSQHDDLTGILNRAAAEKLIIEHLNHDPCDDSGILAVIDVDNFKLINDEHGHVAGDEVLKRLAKAMKEVFRSGDIIGRWGGDEFMVFMRNISDTEVVRSRLDRLKDRLNQADGSKALEFAVTLSIGVAIAGAQSSIASLFKAADKALYSVKAGGRNGFSIVMDDPSNVVECGKIIFHQSNDNRQVL